MAQISFAGVPASIQRGSSLIERAAAHSSEVITVPGIVGWALHAGVRERHSPENTCVCSTSYDHINLDVSPPRVRALYQDFPQTRSIVSPAGVPETLTPIQAHVQMQQWGCQEGGHTGRIPELRDGTVYAAAPVFILHCPGEGMNPLAIASCRFSVREISNHRLVLDVELEQVAVSPEHRDRGLAHLLVLEASRWLGMLARNLVLNDKLEHRISQRVHSSPKTAQGYQIAQAFYSNYCFFGITDELIDNTSSERASGQTDPGSVRAGIGTIRGGSSFEDMIQIPEYLFELDGRVDHDMEEALS